MTHPATPHFCPELQYEAIKANLPSDSVFQARNFQLVVIKNVRATTAGGRWRWIGLWGDEVLRC